jgi:hypothetical protein
MSSQLSNLELSDLGLHADSFIPKFTGSDFSTASVTGTYQQLGKIIKFLIIVRNTSGANITSFGTLTPPIRLTTKPVGSAQNFQLAWLQTRESVSSSVFTTPYDPTTETFVIPTLVISPTNFVAYHGEYWIE